ncbi:retrotransposon protein, putative, ty1-copia subclass, partial [Tanacetum coccineum]
KLRKKKNTSVASTSGIFTIELYSFPNKSWVMGCRSSIRSFDLILPIALIILLDNCHYAPSITKGFVSLSRWVGNGYIPTFTNYGISVSNDKVIYFNAIPRDGIYEIDMHDIVPNVSSIYNVSNKRAKHALDSTYLWHCHFGYLNQKCIEKLQPDRILQPTNDESFDKCKSCIVGKTDIDQPRKICLGSVKTPISSNVYIEIYLCSS